jgi:hypothetical protein
MKCAKSMLAMTLLMAAGVTSAHHSFAAFDVEKQVEIQGVLKEVKFRNPHSWFVVAVTDANGKVEDWAVEGLSLGALAAKGVKRSDFKVGEKVGVTLNPLRTGGIGGSLVSVKLPDGTVVTGGPGQ